MSCRFKFILSLYSPPMFRPNIRRNTIKKVLISVLPRDLPHLLKINNILKGSMFHFRIRHSKSEMKSLEGTLRDHRKESLHRVFGHLLYWACLHVKVVAIYLRLLPLPV